VRSRRRDDTERLDAPRSWLPRGRRLLRACAVCALLLTAAGVLLLASRPAAEPAQQAAAPAPSACAPAAPRDGPPRGTVGFPLHLTDSSVLAVVRAGQRVDVLVQGQAGSAEAVVVAANLPVLRALGTASTPDGVLYLAVSPGQAGSLAAIGADDRVSVTVRSPD
jgi:hypothetical protein